MESILAVFQIRTETMMFNEYLRKIGINSVIMNTPKEAHLSCGICVKFSAKDLPTINRINFRAYRSFKGLYRYSKTLLGARVSPLNY